jgi:Holliday junction resolvase-like predicted endonuclease
LDGSKQTRARRLVAETPTGSGVKFINTVDQSQLKQLLTLRRSSPEFLTRLANVNANVDSFQTRILVREYNEIASETPGAARQLRFAFTDRDIDPEAMPSGRTTRLLEELDRLDGQAQRDLLADIDDGAIPNNELQSNLDTFDSASDYPRTGVQTEIDRIRGTVAIEDIDETVEASILYPNSRTDLLDESGADPNAWADPDVGKARADIVEEDLAPQLLERRGYKVLCSGADCSGGDNGIDIMAWDPDANNGDGDLVVVETKYRSNDGAAGPSAFDSSRDVDGESEAKQMTDDWIEDSWLEDDHQLDVDGVEEQIKNRYGADSVDEGIERAISAGPESGYNREGFFVKNNRNGRTISKESAEGPEGDQYYMSQLVDEVQYLKIGGNSR